MNPDQEFGSSLRGAIESHVAPGAVTVIAAWPEPESAALAALAVVVRALEHHGIARGRQILLIPDLPEADSGRDDRAREVAAKLGITGLAHDRDRSACFTAGRTLEGVAIEINDELREAEAVVLAGPWVETTFRQAPAEMLVSGLLSRRTGEALAGPGAVQQVLRRLSPLVCVAWDRAGAATVIAVLGNIKPPGLD